MSSAFDRPAAVEAVAGAERKHPALSGKALKLELTKRKRHKMLQKRLLFLAAYEIRQISKTSRKSVVPKRSRVWLAPGTRLFPRRSFRGRLSVARSPCPDLAAFFAFLRRSWDSERLTSSLSLMRPRSVAPDVALVPARRDQFAFRCRLLRCLLGRCSFFHFVFLECLVDT